MIRKLLAGVAVVFIAGMVFRTIDGKTRTPERMREILVKECVDHHGKNLSGKTATAFCGCTVDKLMKDHAFEELYEALRTDAVTPAWVKEENLRNARQCAGRLELQINVH